LGTVFVDLDGTLLRGRSSEREFILELLRLRMLGARQVFPFLGFPLLHVFRFGTDVWRKDKAYLSGLDCGEIEAFAGGFVSRRLMGRICPEMRRRLESHLRAGDPVVLLTGTPDFIARPLAGALSIPEVCATVCASRGGRFLAEPPRVHPLGKEKRLLAGEWCRRSGGVLSESAAYGDSYQDVHLLEAVGRPVAVHPDRRLRRHALARAWEVIP